MVLGLVSLCILQGFILCKAIPERGTPQYIHPNRVNFDTSTLYGIVRFHFDFPGAYSDTLPSDFKSFEKFVRDEIDQLFDEIRTNHRVSFTFDDEIKFFRNKRELCSLDSSYPIPYALGGHILEFLGRMYDKVVLMIMKNLQYRYELLDNNITELHQLVSKYRAINQQVVQFNEYTMTIDPGSITINSSFPRNKMFMSYQTSYTDNTTIPQMVITTVWAYFEWESLVQLVLSDCKPSSSSSSSNCSDLTVLPFKNSSRRGKRKLQIALEKDGSIGIGCRMKSSLREEETLRFAMYVENRDKNYSRDYIMRNNFFILWKGIDRICNMAHEFIYSSD
jgi:hypothetical protein